MYAMQRRESFVSSASHEAKKLSFDVPASHDAERQKGLKDTARGNK